MGCVHRGICITCKRILHGRDAAQAALITRERIQSMTSSKLPKGHKLLPIIKPDSVAVFGASNRYSAMGTIILHALLDFNFAGEVYPVHPKESEVLGLKAYSDVADLPQVPDVALIVLPTKIVCEVLEACGQKGIRQAIIVSGGFKESGPEGAVRQVELVKIADKYGCNVFTFHQ